MSDPKERHAKMQEHARARAVSKHNFAAAANAAGMKIIREQRGHEWLRDDMRRMYEKHKIDGMDHKERADRDIDKHLSGDFRKRPY